MKLKSVYESFFNKKSSTQKNKEVSEKPVDKKSGSQFSENYERFFGAPKIITEHKVVKLSEEQTNRLSNLSRSMALKYPNAPITLREGFVYFGYKKVEPVETFLNRSALTITEMVRSFSNSGKKGLV